MKKELLVILFAAVLLQFASAEKIEGKNLVVSFENKPDALVQKNVYTQLGPETIFSGKGNFEGKIKDFERNTLFTFSFFSESRMHVEGIGAVDANVLKVLVLPYFDNAAIVELKEKKGPKQLTINVGFLADLCGDNICQPTESYGDCPEDCEASGKDNYCNHKENGVCDPDCSEKLDPDCSNEKLEAAFAKAGQMEFPLYALFERIAQEEQNRQISAQNLPFLILVAAIIAALVLFGLWLKREEKEEDEIFEEGEEPAEPL